MPYPFDQWHDWLRSVILMMGGLSTIELVRYAVQHRKTWTKGTRDEWIMWTVLAVSIIILSFDGMIEDLPFSVRTAIMFVLSIVMVWEIYKRRKWLE